jgi:hypothetical protein
MEMEQHGLGRSVYPPPKLFLSHFQVLRPETLDEFSRAVFLHASLRIPFPRLRVLLARESCNGICCAFSFLGSTFGVLFLLHVQDDDVCMCLRLCLRTFYFVWNN